MKWTKIVIEKNESRTAEQSVNAIAEALGRLWRDAGSPEGVEAHHIQRHSASYVLIFSPRAISLLWKEPKILQGLADVEFDEKPDLTGFKQIKL